MKRILAILLAVLLLVPTLAGCSNKNRVRVAVVSDTMGLGFAFMMNDAQQNNENKDYKGTRFEFTLAKSYTEAAELLTDKKVDVIAVTTDVAAKFYNQNKGKYVMTAVLSYAPLYVLSCDDTVKSMANLRSKTIYAKQRDGFTDTILQYVLRGNRLDPKINTTVEYFDTNSAVSDAFYAKQGTLAYLAEPAVSTVVGMSEFANAAIDINNEWNALYPDTPITYGCLVTSKKFAKKNVERLKELIKGYEESYKKLGDNYKTTREICKKLELTQSLQAISLGSTDKLCVLTGNDMKTKASAFLKMIYDEESLSLGKILPDDAFYYDITAE